MLDNKNLISLVLGQMQFVEQKLENVSKPCINKTMQFLQALKNTEIWAITSNVSISNIKAFVLS